MFRHMKHKQATRLQNRVMAWVYDLTHGNSVATASIKWLMLPLGTVHINTLGLQILETFPAIDMLIHQTWFEFRSDFHFSDVSTFHKLHNKAAFCFPFIRKFTFPEKTNQISSLELHFAHSDVRGKRKTHLHASSDIDRVNRKWWSKKKARPSHPKAPCATFFCWQWNVFFLKIFQLAEKQKNSP